jgi:hypothetical protein
MLNFIKFLWNDFKNPQASGNVYDPDSVYIDPVLGKLSDSELMISADKARIMHAKALEDVKVRSRKQIFTRIHSAIRMGKTQVRIESYEIKSPEVLTYLDSLGYRVEDVIPPGNNNANEIRFNSDGDELEIPERYHYYVIRWGDPAVSDPVEISVTAVGI